MQATKRLFVTATGVAASLVAAGLIATSDSSVERQVEGLLAKHVAAPCKFESASFGLLDGLHVRGLVVLDPADPLGAPLARVEDTRLDYRIDGETGRIILTGLTVDGVDVGLTRAADGGLGLDRLVEIPQSSEPGETLPVRVTGGRVVLRDRGLLMPGAEVIVEIDAAEIAPGALGVTIVSVKAHSRATGPFEFRAALEAGGAQEVWLRAHAFPLDAPLFDQIAGATGEQIRRLAIGGTAVLHAEARIAPDGTVTPKGTLEIRDGSLLVTLPESPDVRPRPQPFPVAGLSLRARYADETLTVERLTARALDGELSVTGTATGVVFGTGSRDSPASPVLDITAELRSLPVTRELRDHLPAAGRRVPDAYDITGTADVDAKLVGPLDDLDADVEARIRDGTLMYRGYLQPDGTRKGGFLYRGTDVNGWVKQDGPVLTFDATCRHGQAAIHGTGQIERVTENTAHLLVDIQGDEVPLDDDLRNAFRGDVERLFDRWGPSGIAKSVQVRVESTPEIDGTADAYQVVVTLDGRANFQPTLLPVPLRDVRGTVHVLEPVEDGRRISHVRLQDVHVTGESFTALALGDVWGRPSQGTVGTGETVETEDIDIHIETSDLAGALRTGVLGSDRVGENVKREYRRIAPSGAAVLDVHLAARPDATGKSVRSDSGGGRLQGVATPGWDDVPIAMSEVTGEVDFAGDVIELRELSGRFLGSAVDLDATVHTGGEKTRVELAAKATDLPLGPELRAALGHLATDAAPFWDEFRPRSDARGDVAFRIDTARPEDVDAIVTRLRGRFDPLDLALTTQSGTLRYTNAAATLTDLRGTLGSATAHVRRFVIPPDGGPITGNIQLSEMLFPEDLAGLLDPATLDTFAELCPDALAHTPSLDVTYSPGERRLVLDGELVFGRRPGRPEPRSGLAPRGTLVLQPLDLQFGDEPARGSSAGPNAGSARVAVGGTLEARALALRAGLDVSKLSGVATLSGHVGGSGQAGESGDLVLELRDAMFSALERRVLNASATVRVGETGTRLRGLDGTFGGGRLRGRVLTGAAAGFGPDGYAGSFLLEDAVAGPILGADAEDEVLGTIGGRVDFENATGLPEDLRGKGSVTLADARNLDVPVYNSVFLAASQMPVLGSSADSSSFEQAQLEFDLEGDNVVIRDLLVESPTLTLREGRGTVRLSDGRLNVRVKVVQRFGLRGLDQLLDLGQRFAPIARVRLSGTLANPEPPELSLLPFLSVFGEDESPEPTPADGLLPVAPPPW